MSRTGFPVQDLHKNYLILMNARDIFSLGLTLMLDLFSQKETTGTCATSCNTVPTKTHVPGYVLFIRRAFLHVVGNIN